MTAPDAPRPAANVTDVLAAHQRTSRPGGPCRCGTWPPPAHDMPWNDHLAAALAEAGIGPVAEAERRGAERALFTAADDLVQGRLGLDFAEAAEELAARAAAEQVTPDA